MHNTVSSSRVEKPSSKRVRSTSTERRSESSTTAKLVHFGENHSLQFFSHQFIMLAQLPLKMKNSIKKVKLQQKVGF